MILSEVFCGTCPEYSKIATLNTVNDTVPGTEHNGLINPELLQPDFNQYRPPAP